MAAVSDGSVRVFPDVDALNRAAAALFVEEAARAAAARGLVTVALAGGSTPRGMYERLKDDERLRVGMPWDRTHVFWSDERIVPADHPASNFRMAWETLLSHVNIPGQRVHRMAVDSDADAEASARRYEEVVRSVAGDSARLDLMLLGMGRDGHIASLFPGAPTLDDPTRLVVPAEGPPPHRERMTMTLRAINASRTIVILVTGAEKAEVVASVLAGPPSKQLPASLVRPSAGSLIWFLDAAAARFTRS